MSRRVLLRWGVALVALLLVAGCTQRPQQPDPSAWRPTQYPYVAPTMTPAEMAAVRLRYLQQLADQDHLKPGPPPALVRWVTLEESGPVWVQCLKDAGWSAKAKGAGNGVEGTYEPSQQTAYLTALWRCTAQYTINPRLGVYSQVPPQYLRMAWEYTRDVVIPCLSAQGHPATEPLPTVESYVSSGGDWAGDPQLGGDEQDELERACPDQVPSAVVLGER